MSEALQAAIPKPLTSRRRALVAVDPAPAPAPDVLESKLRPPAVRAGVVSRTALVNRLRAERTVPLATVVAPAGYGKTTLLAQLAGREERLVAWLSVDARDNDPRIFLRHLATALQRIERLDPTVIDALEQRGGSIWTRAIPRLTASLVAPGRPFVLILDDVHLLDAGDSAEVVALLVDHVPEGSLLVASGRVAPRLPIARLRTAGRLRELGVSELSLSRREAHLLLRGAGVQLAEAELSELVQRAEGWAAGLFLAALAVRDGGRRGAAFAGADRYLADYFRSESLAGLAPERLAFLRRASVLRTLSGPLCDGVLEGVGSALELEAIEESSLFLVPLDRQGGSYRFHPLFHDLLRRELGEHEPELAPVLNSRAADWFETHGDSESALDHADACGDTDRVARLLSELALPVYDCGRVATLEGWLDRFGDEASLERHPQVAAHGARVHALRGRPDEADRWLAAAERGASTGRKSARAAVSAWTAVSRAALCREGPERMLADAEAALADLPETSRWRPPALLLRGAACILLGDHRQADAVLAEAAGAAERLGATETRVTAVAERALLAAARADHVEADALALQARGLVELGELGDYPTSALELAVSARALLRQGCWDEARSRLATARALTPSLTHALPWLAVQARLELARASVTLRDSVSARAFLLEIDGILRLRPRLGALVEQVAALRRELDAMPEAGRSDGSGLTGAELRLLPLLTTHLSFREIGARLYVSRNTIKTQAISVYRKLGVSSRSEAIDRAIRLGLVDGRG